MAYTPRLRDKYTKDVVPALMAQFSYKSPCRYPGSLDMYQSGIGRGYHRQEIIESGINEMTMIAGQKAVSTKSKKDISNFKLRKGMPIG